MPKKYYPSSYPTSSLGNSITNFQTILIGIIVILFIYIAHSSFSRNNTVKVYNNDTTVIKEEGHHGYSYGIGYGSNNGYPLNVRPNYGYTNIPGDVLMNPYAPPLKDDRYFVTSGGAVPINVSTNIGAVDTEYRQVGILTPVKGPNKILSLMGRPLFTSRDKWQFYTMAENNIKLPISKNGRSGTSEQGCDNVYTGDLLHVEGYNEPYKVTMYDNNVMKYLPFI